MTITHAHNPDLDALYASVLDDPDNDIPRLVLADWLQDHDNEDYARFIRLQCEIARLRDENACEWEDEDHKKLDALEDEERELWLDHGQEWQKMFADSLGEHLNSAAITLPVDRTYLPVEDNETVYYQSPPFSRPMAGFERGFPAWVSIRESQFATPDNLLAEAIHVIPITGIGVRLRLDIPDTSAEYTNLLHCLSCYKDRLRGLDIADNHLTNTFLQQAIAIPTHLKELHIGGNYASGEVVEALPKLPYASQLHTLGLRAADLSIEDLTSLTRATSLSQLKALDIGYNAFDSRAARLIASSPTMHQLQDLNLCYDDMDASRTEILANASNLKHLRTLDISRNDIETNTLSLPDISGLDVITKNMHRLRHLDVSACDINEQHSVAFMRSPAMANLRSLNLSHNDVNNYVVSHIAQSPYLTQLKALYLNGCDASPEIMDEFVHTNSLKNLQMLDITIPPDIDFIPDISDIPGYNPQLMPLPKLAEASFAENLRYLRVSEDDLNQENFRTIMASLKLPRLQHLDSTHEFLPDLINIVEENHTIAANAGWQTHQLPFTRPSLKQREAAAAETPETTVYTPNLAKVAAGLGRD